LFFRLKFRGIETYKNYIIKQNDSKANFPITDGRQDFFDVSQTYKYNPLGYAEENCNVCGIRLSHRNAMPYCNNPDCKG